MIKWFSKSQFAAAQRNVHNYWSSGCCTGVNSRRSESPQHDIFWWHPEKKIQS